MIELDPRDRSPYPNRRELKGIDGWLILPTIGIILWSLASAVNLVDTFTALRDEQLSEFWLLGFFELVLHLGLLVTSIVAAIFLFKHKRSFPKLYIILAVAAFLAPFLEIAVAHFSFGAEVTAEIGKELIVPFLAFLIWAPYMAKSKRVKSTFTQD